MYKPIFCYFILHVCAYIFIYIYMATNKKHAMKSSIENMVQGSKQKFDIDHAELTPLMFHIVLLHRTQ